MVDRCGLAAHPTWSWQSAASYHRKRVTLRPYDPPLGSSKHLLLFSYLEKADRVFKLYNGSFFYDVVRANDCRVSSLSEKSIIIFFVLRPLAVPFWGIVKRGNHASARDCLPRGDATRREACPRGRQFSRAFAWCGRYTIPMKNKVLQVVYLVPCS